MRSLAGLLAITLYTATAVAGEADVIDASADCRIGKCAFSVTVRHADTGWSHYADHWRILAPDGTEIGRRVLYHPHETEQPFTRGLSGVAIPPGIDHVMIEAHDKEHGYGGRRFRVDLPAGARE